MRGAIRFRIVWASVLLALFVSPGLGGSFPPVVEIADLDGQNGFLLDGIEQWDFTGWSVSGAGDVNGDGIDDVILGAPGEELGTNVAAGTSYVVFGSDTGFPGFFFDLANLDGTNGFTIHGAKDYTYSGFSVSAADVNGDDLSDLIIGAVYANSQTGAGYVVFGRDTGFPASLDLADLNGTNGFVMNGLGSDDRAGESVSGVGDLNGDGIEDLILGAPYANPDGVFGLGTCYVVFGCDTGFPASFDLSSLDGGNGFTIIGLDVGDLLGSSVSGAGDVNGDGTSDLILGAPNANSMIGKCYVLFGNDAGFPASFDLATLDGENGFVIHGDAPEDMAGSSVSAAGDVNGDGISDLILGAPYADPGGLSQAGVAYILFGTDAGFPASIDLVDLDGQDGFAFNGRELGDRAGHGVSGAGDVNGDGTDDVIIGAPFSGSDGESYVVFGTDGGFPATLGPADLDGENGFTINGVDFGNASGFSVSAAGDVNADGTSDMLIGAPYARPPIFSGDGYVLFGRPVHPVFEPPTPPDGTVLQTSAEFLIRFDFRATDSEVSETVTIAASGVPPGADFETTPGNPAVGFFIWVPEIGEIGDHPITLTATDDLGNLEETTVIVRVAECFALVASAFGSDLFEAGYTWQTVLSSIHEVAAGLDGGARADPAPPPDRDGHERLPTGRRSREEFDTRVKPAQPVTYHVQVVMWNPVVFPENPEQWSQGLSVTVHPNNDVDLQSYGDPNGMAVSAELQIEPDGSRRLALPFTIEGL